MTALIPIPTDLAFRLLDELSRARALADDESIFLEQLIQRGHRSHGIRIHWTTKLDRALVKATRSNGTIRAFAAEQGIGERACYDRLHKLKKAREAKLSRKAGGGKSTP